MTPLDKLLAYLSPAPRYDELTPCLGEWTESPEESELRYLSINFDGGPKPGVIARFINVKIVVVGQRDGGNRQGGKMDAYEMASGIMQYIHDNPSSSCFVNIIPNTDIIGPMTTEHSRLCYEINLELTI